MAQSEKDSLNGPSIDAMLRGLTERPNVQSTLILSRRDGSIIRASGVSTPEERGSSASAASYRWSQAKLSDGDTTEGTENGRLSTADESAGSADTLQTANPVEILAASIFQFVNNASVLGVTLGITSRNGARPDGTYPVGAYGDGIPVRKKERSAEEAIENGSGDDEVQLLRLRMKHQEIIIFPDLNYICCVVQRVGKAGNAHDRR